MAENRDVTGQRRRNVLLCLVPWAYCVAMTIRYGYDAPYWDQWWKIPMIEKAFEGTLTFRDHWTLINEHRVLFPNLIAVPLARLTHWNLRVELALTLLFATLAFALITLLFRRADPASSGSGTLWPLPIAAALVFSFAQHMVWVWSLHMMITLTMFFILIMIVLLGRNTLNLPAVAFAAAAAVGASYSFGAGIVAWPVGLLMLLLAPGLNPRQRAQFSLGWCAVAGITMLVYFIEYESTPASQSAVDIAARPLALVQYVFTYIGSPVLSYSPFLAATAGAVGLLAAGFLVSRVFRDQRAGALPFIALMAVGGSVACLTGLKQAHEGAAQALSPRYILWPTFFWIGLLGLLYIRQLSASGDANPRTRRTVALAGLLILCLSLTSSIYGTYRADERHDAFVLGRSALLEGRMDDDLRYLYPELEVPLRMRATLVKHKLSIFRDE